MVKQSFYFLLLCALLGCARHAITTRKVTDINYASDPTESQVIAIWGSPDAHAGLTNEFWVYSVEGRETWMNFDAKPPNRLAGVFGMPPTHNVARGTGGRKLSDLTITNGITYEQVTAVWGRPDSFPPTGVEYFAYHLEDGQQVWFEFDVTKPPYRALIALFFGPKDRHGKNLF